MPSNKLFQFLRWFCPDHLVEEIEGDLIQKFEKDVKRFSEASDTSEVSDAYALRRAKRRLLWNTIRFFRPGILLRNKRAMNLIQSAMISNYFKITVRSLSKRKTYALINVFGLAMGMAVCLVISKYIMFESSYDTFHTKGNNIYRVVSSLYTDGSIDEYDGYDLGPTLSNYFPEIKSFTRIHDNGTIVSFTKENGEKIRSQEPLINFVDSTFLQMFTFNFIEGNTKALTEPGSIVITKSIADKYFGSDVNSVGKIINIEGWWAPGQYKVSAVLEDIPENSHFNFKLLLPVQMLLANEFYVNGNSRWDNFHTYIEVQEGTDVSQLEDKTQDFVNKYRGDDKSINANAKLEFQPLTDIHYSPDLNDPGTHRNTIYFFGIIAAFILAIAWVNYINLATARAMERAREVGVKKAIGVLRAQLISQFIFESFLINLMSMVLSIGIALLLLPLLNNIAGQTLTIGFNEPKFWMMALGIFILGSLVSGAYPAFVLSSFEAIEVIKGKVVANTQSFSLRNGLVVFQFACSLFLLVGTFVIYKQVVFMQGQEKNFNTSQVMIVKGPELADSEGLAERVMTFKNELLHFTAIDKVATSFSVPATEASLSTGMRKFGRPLQENRIGNVYWVDPDFMDLYKIDLLAGKFWNSEVNSDMESIIVNEEAVRIFQLGTNEEALHEKLITPGGTFSILGVVKNHHWRSLKEPYEPMIFRIEKISTTNISVQLNGNVAETIELIKQKFEKSFPEDTFSFYFLNDSYNAQYKSEQQFSKLLSMFSVLAILIGCLGLWGLASFTTIHRLKEISIRKVLGASVRSILYLLTGQFIKPLLIASVMMLPLIGLSVNEWLKHFPYRIDFSPDIFLLPLIILFGIALLTISVQTVRAATSNPINSLKND
jgi:putative ABC transport system permease protein